MPESAHQTIVPFQAFVASDGWLMVACPKETVWRRLCSALEKPELAADDRFSNLAARDRNREVLLPILRGGFASRPVADWLKTLGEHGVPAAPINDIGDALSDRQATERDALVTYEHPTLGVVRTVASPLRLPRRSPTTRAPFLGEHTDEVVTEAYDDADSESAELEADGSIATGPSEDEPRVA